MKKMAFSLIAVTCLLPGDLWGAEPEKPAGTRQLMFHVRVLEGDPLGSREAGTIKLLAEPTMITTENRPFTLMTGGEVPFIAEGDVEWVLKGLKMNGKPGIAKDGKVRLVLTLTHTVVEHQSEDLLQLSTTETRVISTVKLGEVTRFRFGKTDSKPDQQHWVEITPELVQPLESE